MCSAAKSDIFLKSIQRVFYFQSIIFILEFTDLCEACRECNYDKVKDIVDAHLPASGWELPNTVGPGDVTTPLS